MKRLLAATLLALVAAAVPGHAPVDAEGPNRAGVVVSFGDGRTESVCVEFAEPEISGAELLRRASFVALGGTGSNGAAVCMIDDVGCRDPSDCWCQCHGAGCRYWAYFRLEDGAWVYSPVGAAQRRVRDGEVDGWAWGSGGVGSGTKPEARTFDEICPLATASTPSATPTLIPTTTPAASSEVAGATAMPSEITVPAQAPLETATVASPSPSSTSRPATTPQVAGDKARESESSFSWQIAAFSVLTAGLLASALLLARRRSHG